MSAAEIDDYLAQLDEPARSTLSELRRTILELLPDAEQGISYGHPAFKVRGKAVAGFSAHAQHVNYLPHSGTVVATLGEELGGYRTTKGSVQFALDQVPPRSLVERLVSTRLDELPG